MDRQRLEEIVMAGTATDEQLEEFFGPDLMNELAHRWRGSQASRRAFAAWYVEVLEPLGIEAAPAWDLFTGRTAIEAFAASLTPEQTERFLTDYPALQAAHQARLDSGAEL